MSGERRRIVMLVDNAVNGDSRVQKQAVSAAAAGWDVVLLGKSPTKREETWQLGGATVRLLPVPRVLGRRRHELRRAPLRRPLAYPPGPTADRRLQEIKARRIDLHARRAALRRRRTAPGGGPAVRLGEAALLVRRVATRVAGAWVALRARQTRTLQENRKRMTAPLDRFTTAFWRRAMGVRSWRRLEPGLWDLETAYGGVIDRLRPDLVHANDFRMLGVGARATLRARERGRRVGLVWDAHEFLPGIKPWSDHPRWHPAVCAHEQEYAPYADAVVTVSEALGELLMERHGLEDRPAVVLNAPDVSAPASGPGSEPGDDGEPDLRAQCGIGAGTPLLVYSGAAAPQRGLSVMIEALPALAGAHVALIVSKPSSDYLTGLQARAAELGVADRVHVLGYVPHHQVVRYLSAADVGVIPIHHWQNHEIALITKFFEYAHAGLPMVVSDVRTMAETTRATGQGEVFAAEDVEDYVRAVREVLGGPERYRKAYEAPGLLEEWSWAGQARTLLAVYDRLLADQGEAP